MASVRRFCDRVLLMVKGELLADGPTDLVISQYEQLTGQAPPVYTH